MNNIELINRSKYETLIGIAYEKLDCHALVEKIFKNAGININYKGSNDMWRNMVKNRMTKELATAELDHIAPGTLVFTIKNDGGEKDRGYHDNMKNAAHVGIVLHDNVVIHSTTPDGVQYDKVSSKRWTHIAFAKQIEYTNPNIESNNEIIDKIIELLNSLRR